MGKEGHQSPSGDPLLDAVDAECMAKDVRSDGLGDPGFVGHFLDNPLNGAGTHARAVVLGKMVVNQPPDPIGHGQDPALGLFAVGSAFSVNDQPALLPEDVIFF